MNINIKVKPIVILLGLAVMLTAGNSSRAEGEEAMTTFETIAREAKVEDGARLISYEQFMRLRDSGEPYVLVDVLFPESYNKGHIENAISFPLGDINKENAERLISKDSKVVVYCANFMCHASTAAAQELSKLGYNVVDYKGGLKEWQEKGNNLVK